LLGQETQTIWHGLGMGNCHYTYETGAKPKDNIMTEQNTLSISELQQKAEASDALAQFALGLYYLPKGVWEFKEGWEFVNNHSSAYRLDSMFGGDPVKPEIYTAFKLADNNHQANAESAFMWFEKAAKNGYAESQYALARCYYEGKGAEQNDKLAFEWAKKSGGQGFAEAYLLLGDCYAQGKGVTQDDFIAMEHYEVACKNGVKSACKKRRTLLFSGKGIKDFGEAREHVRKTIVAIGKEYQAWYEFIDTEIPLGRDENEKIEAFFEWLSDIPKALKQLETSSISAINNSEKNEELNKRMQKLVAQFTHTLGNVIFPDTIYQVAERLKANPDCRKDVLLLNEAYHSEIIIKLQGELLRQRHTSTNPEKFRQLIRACRQTSNIGDKTRSIGDVLDYAASRVTARFLNQHNASLGSIRDNILSRKNVSLEALKQKFEDDILLNRSLGSVEWINQNLRPFKVVKISPLWQKVFILAESHAEALLFGHFSEILFNAFKYADHTADEFLTVAFDESVIGGIIYLTCSWQNPLGDKAVNSLGTGKGLDAIQEDLMQLNDTQSQSNSLLVAKEKQQFQVTMFFKKDLLIDELTVPAIKRKMKSE
jgi:TPR repeat protein